MAEAWIRNPLTCIRECAELLYPNLCWDRGFARKNRLDPQKHLELHYPSSVSYRLLLVGDQGTAELRRGHSIQNPYAVYPTWEYGIQTIPELEEMLARPPGDPDPSLPADERPIPGQEHRVVIIRPPGGNLPEGRALIRTLADLQRDYPDAIIHYHGAYSYRVAFGQGFGAADIDPVVDAAKGRIVLGSGRSLRWEEAPKFAQWINLLGYTVGKLSVPRERTMFNIKSAHWAAENFNRDIKFMARGHVDVDPYAVNPPAAQTKQSRSYRTPVQPGDKLLCDSCSLATTCKYYRDGGVCVIPDTDGAGLARYFKTRDSGQIIDGLGELMQKQAGRFEKALATEQAEEELDPELTKLGNALFNNGVKLAKLVDPALAAAGATKIGLILQGGQGGAGQPLTPQALMAGIVAELEAQGIRRDEITPTMVAEYIAGTQRQAIEAAVVGE